MRTFSISIVFLVFLSSILLQGYSQEGLQISQSYFQEHDEETLYSKFRIVLDPRHKTTLSSEISSSVKEINKEMGDSFQSGDLLIKLDDRIFRANYKKASFLLEKAKELLSAKQELYKDNVASTFELKAAQAEVAIAELDLETAKKELEACIIKAPYQGHIDNLLIYQHEIIQVGQPLIEIVNDKTLLAKLLLPSSYFNKIHVGKVLKIDLKETDFEVSAIITHIDAVIDPASSMFKVFAEIDNREGKLRAGMTGTTKVLTELEPQ